MLSEEKNEKKNSKCQILLKNKEQKTNNDELTRSSLFFFSSLFSPNQAQPPARERRPCRRPLASGVLSRLRRVQGMRGRFCVLEEINREKKRKEKKEKTL